MWEKFQRILDRTESRWALWSALAASSVMGSLAAWAAWATEWLSAWGPIAWVGAGLIAILLVSLAILAIAKTVDSFSRAALNRNRAKESTNINPLADNFYQEVISVSDIFSHFHQILKGKTFRECRFSGPMVMSFGDRVSLLSPRMSECNFICIENGWVTGVVAFKETTFKDCEFDSVTFLIPPNLAKMIYDETGGKATILGASFDKDHKPSA